MNNSPNQTQDDKRPQVDPVGEPKEETRADSKAAQTESKPQAGVSRREHSLAESIALMTARFEKYKGEVEGDFETGMYIHRILALRDEFDKPVQFRREMIALTLSWILGFDETPGRLHNAICAQIAIVHSQADIFNVTRPDQVKEFFGLALQNVAEADEEAAQDATNSEADADSKPEPPEPITPERAEEVTNAVITLMSGPLPKQLDDRLNDALCEMASGPAVADTSSNPDMLRIWLPSVLQQQESN